MACQNFNATKVTRIQLLAQKLVEYTKATRIQLCHSFEFTMPDNFSLRMPPVIQSVAVGEHQIVFIDDFLQEPGQLCAAALQSQFSEYPGVDQKKGYPGLRAAVPAAYSENLTDFLEPLIKANFQVPAQLAIRKSVCAFSLTSVRPEDLGPLQRTPHFDASTPYHMAVLLYLCDESHGGTGFYRHNSTGLQQITADTRDTYLDAYYQEINKRRPPARYFDRTDEQFTFLGMIPARFNRLVVYPGSLLHSACINPARSISSDARTGRLTANTFYDF